MSILKVGVLIIPKYIPKYEPEDDFTMYDMEELDSDYDAELVEIVAYIKDKNSYVIREIDGDIQELSAKEVDKDYVLFDLERYLDQAAKLQSIQDDIDENSLKVNSLNHRLEFDNVGIKVGCQRISKSDAIKIALKILNVFAEKA